MGEAAAGATNCIETLLFGKVCDACDGGALLKLVAFFIKVLSAGIIVLATIGVIVCGVMILTARDNASQAAKAKKRLLDIVIGLIAYALMFTVINFIIPGGIVESTLGTETTSCPKLDPLSGPDKPGDPSDPGSPTDPGDPASGKYPMAHVDGTSVPGYIQCPRNANYTYIQNPVGKTELVDKYFQSVAHSCPFSEVKYSNSEKDKQCSATGTMHYDANKNWCIVNSKIDIWQYQSYVKDNHIGQDGKMCTTDGKCDGSSTCPGASHVKLSDWGMCNYFSYTFASNLNNGEVVSNDAYARGGGYATHFGYWGCGSQGTWDTTWGNRKIAMYNDKLADITLNPNVSQPLPHAEYDNGNLNHILTVLRSGKSIAIGMTARQRHEGNNGHYMAAIGFTFSCASSSCSGDQLVVMNTEGTISTLGASRYKLGYAR